jgi:hypothetical protein
VSRALCESVWSLISLYNAPYLRTLGDLLPILDAASCLASSSGLVGFLLLDGGRAEAWVTKDDLLNAYNRECARDGRPYLTKKAIAQALKRSRPQVSDGRRMVNGQKAHVWLGIGLRTNDPDDGGGGPRSGDGAHHSHLSTNPYEKVGGEGRENKERASNKNKREPGKGGNPAPSRWHPSSRFLTPDELEKYERLVREGMKPKIAREQILRRRGPDRVRRDAGREGGAT